MDLYCTIISCTGTDRTSWKQGIFWSPWIKGKNNMILTESRHIHIARGLMVKMENLVQLEFKGHRWENWNNRHTCSVGGIILCSFRERLVRMD